MSTTPFDLWLDTHPDLTDEQVDQAHEIFDLGYEHGAKREAENLDLSFQEELDDLEQGEEGVIEATLRIFRGLGAKEVRIEPDVLRTIEHVRKAWRRANRGEL